METLRAACVLRRDSAFDGAVCVLDFVQRVLRANSGTSTHVEAASLDYEFANLWRGTRVELDVHAYGDARPHGGAAAPRVDT